jgi:hypothetical protein
VFTAESRINSQSLSEMSIDGHTVCIISASCSCAFRKSVCVCVCVCVCVEKTVARFRAVRRLIPTAAIGVRQRIRSCGMCREQSGTGAEYSIPLPILTSTTALHSARFYPGWYSQPNSAILAK